MFTVETSSLFEPYTDPKSGVTSYILKNEAAPLQQSFYFTNQSMTEDGRYLWFYCAFPPAGDANYGRTLAVVDFESDRVTHFPETQFLDASPMVDSRTGEVYWCNKYAVYKRSPDPKAAPVLVACLPDRLASAGVVHRIATHLTFSADRSELVFDAEIGNRWYLGSIRIQDGKFEIWQEFDYCYNHAQFNPVDRDLVLFAQDFWSEKQNGAFHRILEDETGRCHRLWTIRRGGEPKMWPQRHADGGATHEWWSADGKYIYYVDGRYGVVRIDIETGEQTDVNPYGTWHSHSNRDSSRFVGDVQTIKPGEPWYRGAASSVNFYRRETGRAVDIITENPALYPPREPCVYHIDPHPQFVCGDRYVVFTTTVLNRVSVAVAVVSDLEERTR